MTDIREMHSFAYEGGHLAYRDIGRGLPLVLLHAGFFDHRMWDDQVAALAAHYRVITPDARGHGDSSNADRPFRPTDDLAALLRHLDVGPAVLIGVSMGASTAVDTALEHPELVRALVVGGAGTSEPEWRDPWVAEVRAAEAAALAAGDIEGWIDAFLRFAAGPHRTLDDVRPEVVARLREMARRTIGKHTADEKDWLVPVSDTWARAASITVPVLSVNGALDSPDHLDMAERLIRTVADGRSTTIEDAGHFPAMERPDAFAAELLPFLRALTPDACSPSR
ncbi:alpha/beta fold hydrolase [Streptomyces sp. NRRL S-337]|uniref:alpha/beta fold hydrolase n=1 Tax=Streptomyces sp. NRRL S-337 TaxID=1463900 RepID=UPI0004C8C238|nr:alpha/beta hydrolase [Streptomyces sp. NRRL S-337]